MPMQDLEQIFNAKINRYEIQGMPLQQAAEMAKNEMRNDPRIKALMQKNLQQPTQPQAGDTMQSPASINIQQQRTGGSGDWKTAFINSVLFGNPGDGKNIQETDSGGAEIMEQPATNDITLPAKGTEITETPDKSLMDIGKEELKKAAEENRLTDFAYSQDITPILNAKGYYSQAKANAQAQLPPYNPNYAGEAYTAAVPYMGVNILRKLRGLMDKGALEKEEQETLNKIKESLRFKAQTEDMLKKQQLSGGKDIDRWGQYQDDKSQYTAKLDNVLGVALNSTDKNKILGVSTGAAENAIEEGKTVQGKTILDDAAMNIFASSSDWDTGLDQATWSGFYDNAKLMMLDAYTKYYTATGSKTPEKDAQAEIAKWEQIGTPVKESVFAEQKLYAPYVKSGTWDYVGMLRDGVSTGNKKLYNKALVKMAEAYKTSPNTVISAINNSGLNESIKKDLLNKLKTL